MVVPTPGARRIHLVLHHHDDHAALTRRARRDRDPRMRDRCRAVLLASEGVQTLQIAERLFSSRSSVQRWTTAYRRGGIDALVPKPPPGRPPRFEPAHHEAFKRRILANATEADGVCTLRGEDARRILAEEFGTQLSLDRVYALLHGLGLSCLRPRPRHRKSDPEAQAAWLQRAPLLSAKSSGNTPTGGSRSGSRTRRGSASRAG